MTYGTSLLCISSCYDFTNFISNRSLTSLIVFIVIASSLGLCGGYNANIFKEIKGAIKPGDYVYSIGSKATSYLLKNHQGVTDHKFDDLNTTFDFKDELS